MNTKIIGVQNFSYKFSVSFACSWYRISVSLRRATVCRYNWHSAGFLASHFQCWNINIFSIIRKQFCQTALGNCYGLKVPECWLQFKKKNYCVICYNFRHTFVPCCSRLLGEINQYKVYVCEQAKLWPYLLTANSSWPNFDSIGNNTLYISPIRYDTRCYSNVRSKADMSQLNLPQGTDN